MGYDGWLFCWCVCLLVKEGFIVKYLELLFVEGVVDWVVGVEWIGYVVVVVVVSWVDLGLIFIVIVVVGIG